MVYFINMDYEFVVKCSMMLWGRKGGVLFMSGGDFCFKYMSYYKDMILFYNFYMDIVFIVIFIFLMFCWVVELDEELWFFIWYLYEDGLLFEVFKCWELGNLENVKMIKLLDYKYMVFGVFEIECFVFLFVYECMLFRELCKLFEIFLLIVIYNKCMGEMFVVK